MRTVRPLIAALFLTTAVSAQPHLPSAPDANSPTVYMISVQETDTLVPCEWRARAARNRLAMMDAVDDYKATHRTGFQQHGRPQFLFAHKQNRYSLAVGGFIALRTSYDFDGTPSATDFIPSSIPVPGDYATRQRLSMDASTSRVYIKGIANTRALGRVVVYVSTDFRGGAKGSYTPRLREAYVSFGGFTFGRDVTTFCDLDAGSKTIDFQGPNAYNFTFATMIRYEVPFAKDHLRFGLAAELPDVSGTFGETFDPIPQRVPDFPAYLECAWGAARSSHFRVTGIVRDLYLHNATTGSNTSLLGWGVQASTRIELARALTVYGSGVYGEGISRYIQDLSGLGYDFTPDPQDPARIQTMPMWGWYGAARIHIVPQRLFVSGGYSEAHVAHRHGYYAGDQYRRGRYIFGNVFYNFTSRCTLAAEYLYGRRENMDSGRNHANRVSMQVQYNF